MLSGADQSEVALTLLALLELIKRREARASQAYLFGPIQVSAEDPGSFVVDDENLWDS
ncbi:MAG: hypothetical protein R3C44_08755 [Chloroflexota bacterium]